MLASGDVLRLVLLDLEYRYRNYLAHHDSGAHEQADTVVLETIDQCVRRDSGGELGKLYRRLRAEADHQTSLIEFVRKRADEDLMALPPASDCDVSG